MSEDRRQRVALGVGLAVIVLWASAFTVQKQVYAAMSAGGFLFARYFVVPLVAAALLWRQFGWRWPGLDAAQWRQMGLAALIGQVAHVSLVTHGIDRSTPFSSALILACGPAFTLIVLRLAGQERLTRAQVAGVLIAAAGVLLYLSDKLLRADWAGGRGDLLLLAGALLFAVYSVQVQPLFARHGSVVVMAYTTFLAAPVMIAIDAQAATTVAWGSFGPALWLGFCWAAVVVFFAGWLLWGWVNLVRGVGRTVPLMYLMPPVAGLVSWWVVGERFSAAKLAGAGLAIAGVALAQGAAGARSAARPGDKPA